MIGPFSTYSPPGVYVSTIAEANQGQILDGLRVPVLIGTAQETLTQTDIEIIRGSSSVADTPIFGEDPASSWVRLGSAQNPVIGSQDGNRVTFRVRNYPIVDGEGVGRVTNDVTKVSVTINGSQTVVAAVNGQNGLITLLIAPSPSDVVRVNYFFRRTDARIVDTLSNQVTSTSAVLITPKAENYTIITGTNDVLEVYANDSTEISSIILTAGTRSATDIANDINIANIANLTAQTYTDNQGLVRVQIQAPNNISIGNGNANGALGFNPGDSTGRNKAFRTYQRPIVDGSDGGVTTTEVSRVVVLVNGVQVVPADLDGTNGIVTLQQAPRVGATVTIEYWFNTFQDTFDYLPNNNITSVSNVGISPGRRDYINGADFIVENKQDQSIIQWGTAWRVIPGEVTGGTEFDDTQIVGLLVDDRIYAASLTRYSDPVTNSVSTNQFVLPLQATTGNGRDTPLDTSTFKNITNGRIDLATSRPDLIVVHVGNNVRDALSRPAVTVIAVDSDTNIITLKNKVPADQSAFGTFWYNRIADDTFTFTVETPGSSGVGTYSVTSALNNGASIFQTKFTTKSGLPETIQWPSGVEFLPDTLHYGGSPVSETVTVTFDNALLSATHADFKSGGAQPYDIYTASRIFGGVVVDGNAPVSVDLSTAFQASLVSQPVETTFTALLTLDRLALQIDGVNITVNVSTLTNLTTIVAAINAAVDADVQVHADGSGTFASTSPNALASVVTYGTQELLKINGRNIPTAINGLVSNVKILTPTTGGQTDASAKIGFAPNLESTGSQNALNQPAHIYAANVGPYTITSGVDDMFLFNVDSQDVAASLPSGATVAVAAVVDAINIGWLASATVAQQNTALAQAIVVANAIKADYNTGGHISDGGGAWHVAPDAVNVITSPDASNLSTLITLINEIKSDYNAHISSVVFHSTADTVNAITSANATDLLSALRLISEIVIDYNAHLIQSGVHALNDTVNSVTVNLTRFVAFVGSGIHAGKFEVRSLVNSSSSVVQISALSTANTILGFTNGDKALRLQPSASQIATALNINASFEALAVAYPVLASGLGTFLTLKSLSAGTTSTISFTSVSNTALQDGTGFGIVPGVSGDIGEAAQSGFAVTSSNPNGSSGIGIPGQTYTDAQTGLRFTILPAAAGDYTSGGSFQLSVNSVFTTDGGVPTKAIPGIEITCFNTNGMVSGTTALLTTYDRSGNEPSIGDVYNITYNYAKEDTSTRIFRDLRNIQANFGPPTPEFPLSLAARLALLNGAVLVGLKQVVRAPGSSQAPVNEFIEAIDEQRKSIEGTVKPDIITPLATDPQVFAFLNQHCVFMGSPRQEGERIGVVGVAAGTTPLGVRSIATGLQSELMIVNYPDTYIITVTDNLGNSIDQVVDGTYMAAALAGASCNPAIDVATPWTRREILGFSRLGRNLDPTEANQVAVAGISVIEAPNGQLRIRHGLTTRLDTVITRTPSVVTTIQYVQQSIRRVLDPYIGQKFTGSLIKAVENTLTGMFATLIDAQIITAVSGVNVYVDDNDPTIMRVEAIYVPVFPLEYIVTKLQIRVRI